MRKFILWIISKLYSSIYEEWKQEQTRKNEFVSDFLRDMWKRESKIYEDLKQCPNGCGRTIRGCRCIDKAFGY